MQIAAPTELGDPNSPHLDFIFWDIYDHLTDYVSFDIGNNQPREVPECRTPAPNRASVIRNRRYNGAVQLSANNALSPVDEVIARFSTPHIPTPMTGAGTLRFVNPAYVEFFPSFLQELSKTQFSSTASDFTSIIQPTNGLVGNNMSPAEILAAIPRYGTDSVPRQIIDTRLEDRLFTEEYMLNGTGAITTSIHLNAEPEQPDSVRSDDEALSDDSNIQIRNGSGGLLSAAEPHILVNETRQLASSTPESEHEVADSSLYQSGETHCSSYSNQSVKRASSEASHAKINASLNEHYTNINHLIPSKGQKMGHSCFCGGVDDDTMIACEGDHGFDEPWFHYSCVGIDVVPEDSWYCRDCCTKMKPGLKVAKRPQLLSRSNIEQVDKSPDQKRKASSWSREEDLACIAAVKLAIDVNGRMGIEKLAPFVVDKLQAQGFERSAAAVKLQWNRRLRAEAQLDERRLANPNKMRTSVMKKKQDCLSSPSKVKKQKISEPYNVQNPQDNDAHIPKSSADGANPDNILESASRNKGKSIVHFASPNEEQIIRPRKGEVKEADAVLATTLISPSRFGLKRKQLDVFVDESSRSPVVKRQRPNILVPQTVVNSSKCQAGSSSQVSEQWDEEQLKSNYRLVMQLDHAAYEMQKSDEATNSSAKNLVAAFSGSEREADTEAGSENDIEKKRRVQEKKDEDYAKELARQLNCSIRKSSNASIPY